MISEYEHPKAVSVRGSAKKGAPTKFGKWRLMIDRAVPNPDYMSKSDAMAKWGQDRRTDVQKRRTRREYKTEMYDGEPIGKERATRLACNYCDRMNRELATEEQRSVTPTLAEFMDRFFDEYEPYVQPSTYSSYTYLAKRIRQTEFIDTPMNEVTNAQVKAWIRMLDNSNLSQSSKRKTYQLLHKVYDYALECDVITLADMPFKKHDSPKPSSPNPNPLTEHSQDRLISALEMMGITPTTVAVYLALYTGMRQGEICALQWRDVDFKDGVIYVTKSVGRKSGQGGTYIKSTKTPASRRTIPFGSQLGDILRSRRRGMHKDIRKAGLDVDDEKFGRLYVIGDIEGAFKSPLAVGRDWHSMATQFELIGTQDRLCTFHDLRHTFITELVKSGADIKAVSSLAGHSNAAMTLNIYADADPKAKRQAITGLYERRYDD